MGETKQAFFIACGKCPVTRAAHTRRRTHAGGDQRKPHPLPRFEPRPPSPRAGDRNAAHQPQSKAAGVTRFWPGRSAARRLLHPATSAEAGRAVPTEANHRPLPAWRILRDREEISPKKNLKTDRETEQPIINNASSKNGISPLAQIRSRSLTSRG